MVIASLVEGERETASAKTAQPFLTMTRSHRKIRQLKFCFVCPQAKRKRPVRDGTSYRPIMVLHRTAEGSLTDAVARRLLPLHKNT